MLIFFALLAEVEALVVIVAVPFVALVVDMMVEEGDV